MASNKIKKYLPELKSIANKHGGVLLCENILTYARNPKTKLHDWFNWDDTEAAHQYRLEQARLLLRVTVELLPRANVEYRAFISLTDDQKRKGGGYRITADVMSDSNLRGQLLAQAMDELERFQAKYATINELSEIFAAFRRVKSKVNNKRRKSA